MARTGASAPSRIFDLFRRARAFTAGAFTQTVSPGFLDQAAVLFVPTVLGPTTVVPAFLNQAAVIFSPTTGPPGTLPGFLSQAAVLFSPAKISSLNSAPPFLSQAAVLFAPVVTAAAGGQTVDAGFINQRVKIFRPYFIWRGSVTCDTRRRLRSTGFPAHVPRALFYPSIPSEGE